RRAVSEICGEPAIVHPLAMALVWRTKVPFDSHPCESSNQANSNEKRPFQASFHCKRVCCHFGFMQPRAIKIQKAP
ncbi:hypothetical protein, partial [Chromobacterium haemolyticum]|uniref:hypothetical protein n=1 Tax=Chromobacterium haemolyticum TaxID=394935 RepID=UPI001EE63A12